jgi:glucan phosphoethanolaminetransferase (alkaline phosphatase superfamily)
MRKLLKVLLPPFTGIAVYFIAVRYSGIYFTLKLDEIGGGTLSSFMAYYRYFMPLLMAVAVLTQLLIVVPIWHKLHTYKKWYSKLADAVSLCFICLVFAAALSYPISDLSKGHRHYIHVTLFMAVVQLGYWAINCFILYLLDKPHPHKPKEENSKAETGT